MHPPSDLTKNSSNFQHLFRDRTGTFLETLHIDTFSPTMFFSINMLENSLKASWNNFIYFIFLQIMAKKTCQICMKTRNDKIILKKFILVHAKVGLVTTAPDPQKDPC